MEKYIECQKQAIGKLLMLVILFGTVQSASCQSETINWEKAQYQPTEWYSSKKAKEIADYVLLYQHTNGGWQKNIDMAKPLSNEEIQQLKKEKSNKKGTTIDNGATHTQLRYLAKVYKATGNETYKNSFLQGVDYLLEAQYENGGWPQFYPIKEGYYEHITYNDGAMIGVMELLRNIAKNNEPYRFMDNERKSKAQKAVDKGLKIILATQVKVDGKLTVWCAQHDKDDFSPAKARAYELPSLSGKESVDIVEYLLKLKNPSEEVKTSIRGAVDWFGANKIMGEKVIWKQDESLLEGHDRLVVEDPNGGTLWARFNEIGTNKPMFVGRDGVVKRHLNEIEQERRIGYSYIDNYAEKLLKEDYPEWEAKH